jgi:NAD(P)-dependent dehydrogenase (short-subunit alcohol dehydrogenase family)
VSLEPPRPEEDAGRSLMSRPLEGKIAIVTGAGTGIGAAGAARLAAAGASVICAGRDAERLAAVVGEIEEAGFVASVVPTDLSEQAQVEALIGAAVDQFGGLDILVNNAAALEIRESDNDVVDISPEIWEYQLRVNLTAPMLASKWAIPIMIERGGGSIIHITSASAILADTSRSGYAATKAGLAGLSRSIAVQYGKQGVRSNCIAPGTIETALYERSLSEAEKDIYLRAHMTARVGRPDDVAAMMVFLASDDAEFVTGQHLSVDGGVTAHLPWVSEVRQLDE